MLKVQSALYLSMMSVMLFQWSLVPPRELRGISLFFNDSEALSLQGNLRHRDSVDTRVVRPDSIEQGTGSATRLHDEDTQGMVEDKKYFSSCMVTMDDNHFWPGTTPKLKWVCDSPP
jgi:hypothetical protein